MGKPKPHKTNKPEVRNAIVASIAQGKSQMETAKETRVSVSTISRLVKKPDIRELIEDQRERLSSGLPQAAANVLSLINGMESAPDTRSKELGYKASSDLLKSFGLFPSATPSIAVTQIYNENAVIVSPELARQIRDAWNKTPEGEVTG